MNISISYFALYLALFYILTNIFGFLIEKVKIPKIYAALFLGIILSGSTFVTKFTSLPQWDQFAKSGMYCLLFLLGYSLNLKKLEKNHNLIFKITFWVISSELIVGSLILHYIFHINWLLSGVIAISFATVGEIALLPILEEFKLVKTKLGQIILGVAVVDDVIEILAFVLLFIYIGSLQINEIVIELIPVFVIFAGAIVSKITNYSDCFEKVIKFIALFVLGPLFFFYAGSETSLAIFLHKFWIIVVLTLIIKVTKVSSAYFASRNNLGTKKSIILGVSLGIKFSTSIIILFILLDKGIITEELFSILVGIKVLFKFIVPILLSYLLTKWQKDLVFDKD